MNHSHNKRGDQLYREYLSIDPRNLGEYELEYELRIRGIWGNETNEQRIEWLTKLLHLEKSLSFEPNRQSPYLIDSDLFECEEACSSLETIADSEFIDQHVLNKHSHRVVPLIMRWTRMMKSPLNRDQRDQLDRLSQRMVVLYIQLVRKERYDQNLIDTIRLYAPVTPDLPPVTPPVESLVSNLSGSENTVHSDATNQSICYNCRRIGHFQGTCSEPKNEHCYKCGSIGVIWKECPNCAPGPTKNDKVNSS